MTITRSQRGVGWAALCLLLMPSALPAHGRTHHSEAWARERFAAAERMREALNGRPPADRTRRDYQRVLNSYRSIYYGAPTSTKADPSVVAVAETLVEMGRRFHDDKILSSAIGQYKFLRREYPGSKYRFDALFTIGEIYSDDLNDPQRAGAAFREFLKRYPHHRLADDARRAIADLDQQAVAAKKAPAEAAAPKEKEKQTTAQAAGPAPSDSAADGESSPANMAGTKSSGELPRVTGIRHWSTPDYTRVAIDVESEVKFASQRLGHPERIFFDLRNTRLASTLVGKSFDVDDGFLKKIRVAQFQPGRTRVVLEVDDLSEYHAFLLPDPYRLIIDIHGKDIHKAKSRTRPGKAKEETAAAADVEAAPKAGVPAKRESADPGADVDDEEISPMIAANRDAVPDETPTETTTERKAPQPARKGAIHTTKLPSGVVKTIVEPDEPSSARRPAARPEKPEAGSAGSASNQVDPDDSGATADPPAKASRTETTASRSKRRPSTSDNRKLADVLDAREAQPTAHGGRSLTRVLGLKIGRIVIDPGHGGHDTGTIGPNGLEEKELVLEVGRRLGRLLESRLGAEVVYTRRNDTFIPLETRTAIANRDRADLFISIHANSSGDPAARGVETYYLNFTSSPEALEVAARENAVSEKSIYELQDLVKKIALKEKIEESREFAADVQDSLHDGLASKSPGIRNRGVKKAPFIVLIGANMPSILAEISFVSNPADERRLETSEYRQRIAESLYRGIAKYVQGLSGVKVASKMDKAPAQ